MCNFISEGRPSYPLSSDMITFLCRVNRVRVMIDFLRENRVYPVFLQNTLIQLFERGP